ncbi:MAG: hypothetical protein IJX69_06960 [Oscillospiraceae bacterium]|nr:hypothetical protein [Oscillospiraceae bacterium]
MRILIVLDSGPGSAREQCVTHCGDNLMRILIVLDSGPGSSDKLSFSVDVSINIVGAGIARPAADGCEFASGFSKYVTSCRAGDQCLATVAALRLTDA